MSAQAKLSQELAAYILRSEKRHCELVGLLEQVCQNLHSSSLVFLFTGNVQPQPPLRYDAACQTDAEAAADDTTAIVVAAQPNDAPSATQQEDTPTQTMELVPYGFVFA